ncbi:hypothetical protein RJ641_016520, partial [Dillenia turbinata]
MAQLQVSHVSYLHASSSSLQVPFPKSHNSGTVTPYSCPFMTTYGTLDKASDQVYQNALKRPEDSPHVVHLTHFNRPESIYHLCLGLRGWPIHLKKQNGAFSRCGPITFWSMMWALIHGRTFTYFFKWQREAINGLIEEAIIEAEGKGTIVLNLGLLNQAKITKANRAVLRKLMRITNLQNKNKSCSSESL